MMHFSWIKKLLYIFFLFITFPLAGVDALKEVIDSADVAYMVTPDNRKVRYAQWHPSHHKKNITMVIFQGRASFIEKHSELIKDLLERGYDVFALDWVGQGLSTRLMAHPQKGHIDTYITFLKDADQFLQQVVKKNTVHPIIIFGSSMGGHIALRYMAEYPHQVAGAVLESPMLDVPTKPFPKWFARILIYGGSYLGFEEAYAPGYGDFDPSKDVFEKSNNTSDKQRFLRQRYYTIEYPSHVNGGPTFGWVKATFDSLDKLKLPHYLQKIKEPILLLNAGQDTTVENINDAKLCAEISKCRLINYPNSKHHIVVEKDEIRDQFWKDFDEFMKTVFEKTISVSNHPIH